jgi:hypothetical protein
MGGKVELGIGNGMGGADVNLYSGANGSIGPCCMDQILDEITPPFGIFMQRG